MFRGLIKCAVTGRVVTTETKRRKRADGSEHEFNYLAAWNLDNPKKQIYVREDEIIRQVENIFKSMYIEPETLAKVIEYVKSSSDNKR